MDPKVHKFLGPDRSFLVRGEHIEKGAHAFRSKAFNAITCNKFSAVVDILASGRCVTLTTAPLFWASVSHPPIEIA